MSFGFLEVRHRRELETPEVSSNSHVRCVSGEQVGGVCGFVVIKMVILDIEEHVGSTESHQFVLVEGRSEAE